MCEYKNSREKELCFGRVLIDKKLLSISFFALDCILKACFVQLALLCCVFNTALAQSNESHTISGRIVSASGEGISDVNVFASHTNNKYKVISHSLSDLDGSFMLTFAVESDSILINLTGIGITPKSIVFPNHSMNQDIVVEEKAQELPEVVIRAEKVYSRGDTINYSVPAFQNKTDISIGQVLGRIPGISVSELGQIFYKGLPIKNFYIEGLDLMKGRYGIATNSIDPNSIASIQLLENHQDVEALKDLLPEERASINLKLKSGVKGVFNLIGTLGLGYDKKALWENELIATSFKRNSQLLATYKGNNSGVDLMQELRSFDGYDLSKTPILTQIEMPGPPNIKKKYHYMNRSHSGTYNNIFRVGQKGELGFNLAYLNNFYNRERHSKVLNQLPDKSVVQLEELFSGESRSNMLYGIATYLLNEKTTYINVSSM